MHTSSVLHALPPTQGAVLLACRQAPVPGSHASFVQGLESLQFIAPPGRHVPNAQVSPTVQPFPSSQASALLACVHPVTASHPSVVHGLASSHDAGVPPHMQFPRLSRVVQAFPSAQGAVLLA